VATKGKKPVMTLAEFSREERKKNCPVCKLPAEIRGQLGKPASEKKISRDQQVRWVQVVTGVTVSVEDLNKHNNGRHDATA